MNKQNSPPCIIMAVVRLQHLATEKNQQVHRLHLSGLRALQFHRLRISKIPTLRL